jgi:hypothetical protein
MDHFAGLDVSVKETSVCIVDDVGKIVREVKVASEPEADIGQETDVGGDTSGRKPSTRAMMDRPIPGGLDANPWNEATRIHRGSRRRSDVAARGVCPAPRGRKGTRLQSCGGRRYSQAISLCSEAVRVPVIAEIFGCSPAAA